MSNKNSADDGQPVDSFLNRELSFLGFARRVLAQVEDARLPLLERIKFAGITGMLHDEFFMKRISGLKRQVRKGSRKFSLDGRTPAEELAACRATLLAQAELLARAIEALRPEMERAGFPVVDHASLGRKRREALRDYFRNSVLPILTPLAVDAEHPFPFISNLGLNLAVQLPQPGGGRRFVRIKVPGNRPRWVRVPGGNGWCPMEQVIEANLDLLFPGGEPATVHLFRVTRGAEGDTTSDVDSEGEAEGDGAGGVPEPGSIVRQVSHELKARRFAGTVRLEVDAKMPKRLVRWLSKQLQVDKDDVYPVDGWLGACDLSQIEGPDRDDLRYPDHEPVSHPRLRDLDRDDPAAIFEEVAQGDLLLHHPYHSFDDSVLRFLASAAHDPAVLAIKLTIYRTNRDSPIVLALAEAARRGKQVAVLVEITARFDEAPNIAWGQFLEQEGVHVCYGVQRLKTHVKLALVVREERQGVRRYLHVGTGNYHTGTARIYEDLGLLTCDETLCEDAAAVFNALTGAVPHSAYRRMLVAPDFLRARFLQLVRREAKHARAGRPSGIRAKMNQLQDPGIIRELYAASRAGVPISLLVRGLCCLRPGVAGMSEKIRVYSVVGRFLEHSRIFHFVNGGNDEYYLGSADWMKRNLDRRVETVVPVEEPAVRAELSSILEVYEGDNATAWDCLPDGGYVRRTPGKGEERRAAQEMFMARAAGSAGSAAAAGSNAATAGAGTTPGRKEDDESPVGVGGAGS